MNRKAFTLVELMVVVLIIGLLISILLPSLGQAMEAARQTQCAAKLNGFGKTFRIYTQQNNGFYPSLQQGKKFDGFTPMAGGDQAIDTQGSLWLMVVSSMTSPETLICPSDRGATPFSRNKDGSAASTDIPFPTVNTAGVGDVNGGRRCWSYSYQIPNGDTGNPSKENPNNTRFAIMADRAPFLEDLEILDQGTVQQAQSGGGGAQDPDVQLLNNAQAFLRNIRRSGGSIRADQINSPNHAGAGQNVLFQDGHVQWYDHPFCGIRDDNIYTWIKGPDETILANRIFGEKFAGSLTQLPFNDDDSVLINVYEGTAERDPKHREGRQ